MCVWLTPRLLQLWCSAVYVECLLLYPCCVVMCGMLSVIKGTSIFSSVLAIVYIREIGLYKVPMWLSLFGFGIGSFHT